MVLKKELTKIIFTCIIFICFISCSKEGDEYILNEEFDSNKLGWVQEKTESHFLDLHEGKYFLHSIDTSFRQTSTASKDHSYLWKLPENYEISSSIEPLQRIYRDQNFGILLFSESLDYRFEISTSGKLEVSEYNGNNKKDTIMISKRVGKFSSGQALKLIIKVVNNDEFTFFINDKLIGNGQFRAKSWENLRIFCSSGSSISIDYLKIKVSK